jgi:membrane protein YqaA with SNARE-associated domain
LRRFARSPFAILAAGLWGYAEATRFWLVPDILLTWIGLNRPRSVLPSVIAATVGAVFGGVRMHQHAREERARLTEIPGINDAMLVDASERFATRGWVAVVRAPLDGIPYKVYATESGVAGRTLVELIAWTPVARAWRFLLSAAAAALIGGLFSRSVGRGQGRWLVGTLGIWTIVYRRYFARLRRRYGSASAELSPSAAGPQDGAGSEASSRTSTRRAGRSSPGRARPTRS